MDMMNKRDFQNEYRAYADSMTGFDLTDDELFSAIRAEAPDLEDCQIHWIIELVRDMEKED